MVSNNFSFSPRNLRKISIFHSYVSNGLVQPPSSYKLALEVKLIMLVAGQKSRIVMRGGHHQHWEKHTFPPLNEEQSVPHGFQLSKGPKRRLCIMRRRKGLHAFCSQTNWGSQKCAECCLSNRMGSCFTKLRPAIGSQKKMCVMTDDWSVCMDVACLNAVYYWVIQYWVFLLLLCTFVAQNLNKVCLQFCPKKLNVWCISPTFGYIICMVFIACR